MSMTYELAIECGSHPDAAAAIARHFDGLQIPVGPAESPTLSVCRCAVWWDSDHGCWCSVIPSGASLTGRGDNTITSAPQIRELATSLYAALRVAPPFRYAVCGFEVTPFDTYRQLMSATGVMHRPFPGLVLDRSLWEALGCPDSFVPFSEGRHWLPFD